MKNTILLFILSLLSFKSVYSQIVVGDCNSGGATATGGYTDFTDADNNYASGQYDFSPAVVNKNITTYHLVNSGATGSIGFDISHHSSNTSTGAAGCISNNERSAVLYPVGGCSGTAISPTIGANNNTYYNPEFKNLTPNTNYILVVTTTAVSSCSVDQMWVTYYSINSSCSASVGTVSVSGGTSKGANEYDLTTNGATITISSTGSVLPSASSVTSGATSTYGYFVFSQQPTLPFTDVTPTGITSLPGFEGVVSGTSISDNNALGESSSIAGATTLWFIPAVFDKKQGGLTLDDDGDGCYAVGTPIKVNYVVTVTPTPCGTCSTPNCPVTQVPLYSNRDYSSNCDTPSSTITNQTYVTYHTVKTDANGAVGLVQQVNATPQGCATRTAVLKSTTNTCSATDISSSVSNANSVSSGFNPEWYNLSPTTNYVAVVTTVIPSGCVYTSGCLNAYGVPNPPPPPTCKPIDFEFYSDAGLTTKFSGTSFTCSSSPVFLAPKDVGTVYFGASSSPDSGWPFPVIVVDVTATSGNLNSNNTIINIYDAVTGSLVDSSPIGDGSNNTSTTGSNFHFFAKPGGYTFSLDKTNTNSGTYSYTAYDVMTGAVIGSGTLTITSGAESTKSVVLKPTNYNGGFTCATCGSGALIQGIGPQYLDEIGIGTFDPSKAGVGTHTITYNWDNGLTGTANCKGSKSITVTVTGGPTITPTLTDVCAGATSTNFTYTSTGTPTKYSIDWNTAANTAGLTDVTDVALGASPIALTIPGNLPAGTYTGSLTAKNASGCSSAAQTVSFKVNAAPVITGTASICVGSTAIDWKPSTGVTWTTSDATVATVANGATLSGLKAGTATITAKDGNNCSSTKAVTINAKPTITGTLTLCEGATSTLTGSGTPAVSNAWVSSATTIATVSVGVVSGVSGASGSSDITYTDNNGCTNKSTVTVNPKLAPSVTCGASTATSVTFDWSPGVTGATGYDLVYNNNGAGNQNVTNHSSTTYQITGMTGGTSATIIVTPVGAGCFKASTLQTCTADNCPTPNIDSNPTDVSKCEGQSATFTVAASSNPGITLAYQWEMSTDNGTSYSNVSGAVYSGSTTNSLSVSDVTGLNSNRYRCVVTEQSSGTGCKKTSTAAILTVNQIPVIDAIANVDLCHGASSNPINFTSTPTGAIFTWLNNTPSIGLGANGNGNISSFSATNTGGAAVTGTVTVSASLNGCTATDKTFTITVNPSVQPTVVCATPTQTSVTFDWSPGQTGATSYNLSYSINGTGSYTATSNTSTYTVNSLTQGDQVDVTILPVGTGCFVSGNGSCTAINCNQPTFATTPSDLSVCEGDAATLSGSSNDAQSIQWQVKNPLTGVWTDISGETNSTISYPTTVKLMDGSQYRLKAIESSGNCPNFTSPVTLTIKSIPTMNALSDKEFCPSTLVNDPSKTLDFDFKIAESGTPTFTWTSDNQTTGVTSGGTDVSSFASFTTASPSADVISTISVTPKLNGCTGNPETFKITVKPTIKPVFSTTTSSFNSVKFTWSSSSIDPAFWNIDTSVVSTPNAATAGVYKSGGQQPGTSKEYTLNNLPSSKTAFINVTPSQAPGSTGLFCPQSDFLSGISTPCTKPTKPADPVMNEVCEGAGFSVTGVSLDPLATFQWKISTDGGNTWNNVSANDFTTSGTTNVLTTALSKQYMKNALVKVVLTDVQTGTCQEESNTATIVLNPLPTVSLVAPTKNSLCVDDNEESAFVQAGIGTAPFKVDYTLNGVTTTNQDIAGLEIKFPTTVETNYSLSIDKVVDGKGCVSTLSGVTTAVSVHNNPTPKFALSDTIGCYPATIDFFDISGETYSDVTWDFGTGSNSSKDIGTTSFTYTKEGDYSITYTVVNSFGCEGQLVKKDTIHIKSIPHAVISADRVTISVYENEVKFNSKLSQNGSFYKWDFGDNTQNSTAESVNHTYDPNQPGNFKVTLIVTNSVSNQTCGDTAVTWIKFPEEVVYFIPNSFTPNGDEFNNTFQPIFTSGFDPQHYLFTIFNRWGEIVFESKNPAIGWDGTFGGILLNNDTFVWKLGFKEKANDDEHYKTGHVNLIR
jgi:gliding motility-associated-like protein